MHAAAATVMPRNLGRSSSSRVSPPPGCMVSVMFVSVYVSGPSIAVLPGNPVEMVPIDEDTLMFLSKCKCLEHVGNI